MESEEFWNLCVLGNPQLESGSISMSGGDVRTLIDAAWEAGYAARTSDSQAADELMAATLRGAGIGAGKTDKAVAELEREVDKLRCKLDDAHTAMSRSVFDQIKQPNPIDKSNWRPWTDADMRDGMEVVNPEGTVIKIRSWTWTHAWYLSDKMGDRAFSYAYMFWHCKQPDGSPCGVKRKEGE